MPQVDFYLLDRSVASGKLQYLCRLTQKIFSLGNRIFIYTENPGQSTQLDDLLWTFSQNSFVPHCQMDDSRTNVESPVIIGHRAPSTTDHNVLISLLNDAPGCIDEYQRIAELVDNTPEDKASARIRFKTYRDRGWTLETHNVRV